MKNFLPTDAKVAKALGLSRTWRKSINTSEVIASLEEIVESEIAKVENGETFNNWNTNSVIVESLTLCINTEEIKESNLLSLGDAYKARIPMVRKVLNMLKVLNDSDNKEDNDFATRALAISFRLNDFNDVARYILRNSLHDKTVDVETGYIYGNNEDIDFRCAGWGAKLWELIEYVENNDETVAKKDIEKAVEDEKLNDYSKLVEEMKTLNIHIDYLDYMTAKEAVNHIDKFMTIVQSSLSIGKKHSDVANEMNIISKMAEVSIKNKEKSEEDLIAQVFEVSGFTEIAKHIKATEAGEKTNSATVSIETLKTAVRVSAQYLAAVASESHTEGEKVQKISKT